MTEFRPTAAALVRHLATALVCCLVAALPGCALTNALQGNSAAGDASGAAPDARTVTGTGDGGAVADASGCPAPGQKMCNGACTNTQTDMHNCGGCGFDCAAVGATDATCSGGICNFSVAAADAADWKTPDPCTALFTLADGTVGCAHLSNQTMLLLDPTTGGAAAGYPNPFPNPGGRITVWIKNGATRSILGSYQDTTAYKPDGTLDWDWGTGCCNVHAIPLSIDVARARGHNCGGGGLSVVDLADFANDPPQGKGIYAVGGGTANVGVAEIAGDTVYTVGVNGWLNRYNIAIGAGAWAVDVSLPAGAAPNPPRLTGATTAGGDLVTPQSRQLVRVNADGTVAWMQPDDPTTAPVIDDSGNIYVGTAQGVIARAPDGTLLWTDDGATTARRLLVADNGLLYAATAASVVGIDRTSGHVVETYANLPQMAGYSDLMLDAGRLFVSTGSNVWALRVPARGYPQAAAWPVEYHDNQRTSNEDASLGY